jgi:hypothetical protein
LETDIDGNTTRDRGPDTEQQRNKETKVRWRDVLLVYSTVHLGIWFFRCLDSWGKLDSFKRKPIYSMYGRMKIFERALVLKFLLLVVKNSCI